MLTDTTNSPFAVVYPPKWDRVKWEEGSFWQNYIEVCAKNTVPHIMELFESDDISHVVKNFQIAANQQEGEHQGTPFGDGDFYKWMEAAVYTANITKDHILLEKLESYIKLIEEAQQKDGYISTKQIIGERAQDGTKRLGDINDFEVYNMGHLFTAACLHKRITGRNTFFQIAVRAADYLENLYEKAQKTGEVKTAVCPSHYMGLVEMYRTTKEERYLKLAETALLLRDSVQNGMDDNQDKIPLLSHEKIVGHAVRANYLYAGTADLYAETGDMKYKQMLDKVWRNLMHSKVYITGGCGALYNGTSPYGNFWVDEKVHQAYGYEYQLPNVTAYNETCASIGGVYWAYRMFLTEPKAEYFDYIERAMYNVNLASVSIDGKKFFYENMLRRAKKLPYELIWPLTRTEYINSFCCPPNLARVMSQTSEYAYLLSETAVYFGMYGASTAQIKLKSGAEFCLKQKTNYPWDGNIEIEFADVLCEKPFALQIRIPGWVEDGFLCINQTKIQLSEKDASTYKKVEITDPAATKVGINFKMPIRYTTAHPLVEETNNQAAVERGPLVYCMESDDVEGGDLDVLHLIEDAEYQEQWYEIEGKSLIALKSEAWMRQDEIDRSSLYQTLKKGKVSKVPIRMIPYFAWDNRTRGQMRIWMPVWMHFC